MVLLAYCLGVEKEELFRTPERELSEAVAHAFADALDKRMKGMPVSYIRRRKEFYGRDFYVDERVLVPRPETETLIEQALEIIDKDARVRTVHDCCTGSGCVAVTLKAERPHIEVGASDLSPDALEVARLNARRLLPQGDTGLRLLQSDLLESVPEVTESTGGVDLLTANPPYVPSGEYRRLAEAGWPEPALALDGGRDGLSILRRLIPAAFERTAVHGYFLCEIGYDQGDAAQEIAWQSGFASIKIVADLGGRDRLLMAGRTAQP